MKTLIAIPTGTGNLRYETVGSLMMLQKTLGKNDAIIFLPRMQICDARNLAVKQAVEGKYDYLVFIDDDMVIPDNFIIRMKEEGKDIFSALNVDRSGENQIKVFKKVTFIDKRVANRYDHIENSELGSGVVEVGATGMACVGIKRKVFKNIYDKTFGLCFHFRDEIVGETRLYLSEDLDFCDKANQLGYKIFIDTSLLTGHIGEPQIHYLK